MSYNQSNIEAFFRLIGSMPHQEYVERHIYHYIKTKDSVWPNQVFNLRADARDMDGLLDDLEKEVQKELVPEILMCNIHMDRQVEIIKQRNYVNRRWAAMSFDLTKNTIPLPKTSCAVHRVITTGDLKKWLQIVESELMGDKNLNPAIFYGLLQDEHCHFFMAFNGKQAVATALLFQSRYSAGIYLVATLEAFRGRGIGTDITAACLQRAKELNCTFVHLQATKSGEPVYRSLGFKKYGTINVFRVKK